MTSSGGIGARARVALALRPLVDRAQLPGSMRVVESMMRGARGEMDVRLSTGVRMRVDLSDRVQRLEAFRAYERREMRLMRSVLRPGGVMIDAGAHVGYYALHAAAAVGPTGSVHAFEPAPANAARLRANAALNSFATLVVNETAVAATSGEARFGLVHAEGETGWSALAVPSGPQTEETRARTVSLDDYCAAASLARVDFVKIDVQGTEMHVLDGARGVLERHHPHVLVEAIDELSWQGGNTVGEFVARGRDLGYDVWSFRGRGRATPVRERAGSVLWFRPRPRSL
jgi:FkbM family methyltransferase